MNRSRGWTEAAPGFFRLCTAEVNCYLVRKEDGLTLFDAGLPRTRGVLRSALAKLGARMTDIQAVVLTHGHFDHVGLARGIHRDGARVFVHADDAHLARHPYSYRPATPRVPYLLSHPRGIPVIGRMAVDGALAVRGVEASGTVAHGHRVDVPGEPLALWTPGHTAGHCSYLFEEEGILLTGDALVTLDPYTGEKGPQIVASAATADVEQSMRSLDVIDETSARLLLPGHGTPHREGASAAVEQARRRGPH